MQNIWVVLIHMQKSGVADFVFENEIVVLQQIRRLVDFPSSNKSKQKIKKECEF